MKTFNEFLQEKGVNLDEIFGMGRKPEPAPTPAAPVSKEVEAYRKLRQQSLSGFKPDVDRPKDAGEERFMSGWKRSKKK